ncbi:MAG: heme exporter protein CcmB [Cytophagales bacterium]|nr:heme exporter protein CcmB [Cytophagales bacterium]
MQVKAILQLLKKEFLIEWRQKYAINGILLYVACTVFICYLSFHTQRVTVSEAVWNALFWIILLFTAVNAIAKSFLQESRERTFYIYSIASATHVIIAKMLYNTLLMLVLGLICTVFYSVVMGNPILNMGLFAAVMALGALGFSGTLTMISSIASKAENSGTLMAVLGIPVMIPILLMSMKVSKNAILGLDWAQSYDEVVTLAAVDLIVGVLSLLLFPYLWRS